MGYQKSNVGFFTLPNKTTLKISIQEVCMFVHIEEKQKVPCSEEIPPKINAPPFLPEPKPRGQPGFELLLLYYII